MRTVDLFCGCGGLSLGFESAGFEITAGFERWHPAAMVYRENFSHEVFEDDLAAEGIPEKVAGLNPEVIIGGPPCQDFSSAGPNNHGSARANLLERFVDIVEAAEPHYFVIENVPRTRLRPVFERSRDRLMSLGYGLTIEVLDAAFYGVPQKRKRLFVVGGRSTRHGFLREHLYAGRSEKPLTLREFFGDELDTDFYFRVPTNYNRRGVFSVDEPSLTIRAVDRPIPPGYPGHPDDPVPIGPDVRVLSVRERSRIQTFPVSFQLEGSKTDLNRMIGNAVPVKLAEHVARALKRYESDGI